MLIECKISKMNSEDTKITFFAFAPYSKQVFFHSFTLIAYLIFYILHSVLYLDSTHLTNDSIDPTLIVCRRISGMLLLTR